MMAWLLYAALLVAFFAGLWWLCKKDNPTW